MDAYIDDYYYRIHVTPLNYALGNISSTQSFAAFVWNAWFQPRTLTAVDPGAEGINLTGQPPAPLLFGALAEKIWLISVTPDGSPVLDTRIVWEFSHGEAPAMRVTANRIVAWGWIPNWENGIVERLEWATDILQSESMVEQRRALRTVPRRAFEADFIVAERERQMLDLMLFDWGARIWVIPIWPQIQLLHDGAWAGETRIECITEDIEFHIGGLIVLRGATAREVEVLEVAEVLPDGIILKRAIERDWPPATRLYPARTARLSSEPTLTRESDRIMTLSAVFNVLDASMFDAAAPDALYRGHPLLDQRPDETETLTRSFARLSALLDSGLSTPRLSDIGERAMPMSAWRWLGLGRAEEARMRRLLYFLAGRQGALWLPTHADDLTVIDIAAGSSAALDVAWCGYTRFGAAHPGRRDIRVELRDGAILLRRITAATELTAEIERLAVDQPWGQTFSPDDVVRVCFMTLCRMDSDGVAFDHVTDSVGVAQTELIFRGVRDDEF
jgi:hypothetical protein